MKKFLLLLLITVNCKLETVNCFAQSYVRTDTIPVKENSNWLKMPWVGGHNYCQFSDLDINFDGIKDLFVFDRTGHKVTTYINGGTPNTVDYYDSTFKYASKFPHLEDWVLLRDYNCDGKPDIFTYAITVGGIKVWRNTSSGGNLQFTLQTPYVMSNYNPSVANLYCSRVDIPTIDDVDGDGDLDVLTFDFSGLQIEFHINKSKELGYNCDSLIFQLDPNGCWGNFQENMSNCSVYLGSVCRHANPDSSQIEDGKQMSNIEATRERHAGSCSVCIDMDDDGDKEIILGDLSCCGMTLLTNGGTPSSANMIAKDTIFPSNNIPVNILTFPCGYFLDVNNDGNRDLIAAPNAPGISIDNENIWYYENTGTDSTPVFARIKKDLFLEDMIDVGSGADPVFFDFTGDGLTDLLISNYSMNDDSVCSTTSYTYNVKAYQNIGTASSPKFDLVNTDYANLSSQLPSLSGKHLTFGDLDGDAKQDMMIGDYNGFLHYFKNTSVSGPAIFTLTTPNYTDDAGNPIDVGNYATPQLIDADRDGDLDLIIGERAGNLNYYQNIGTPSSPLFDSGVNSLFGGVDVLKPCCTGYSVPFMYDSAGSYRLIVGSEANRNYPEQGSLWYYNNIDGNLAGNFTLVDSLYQNIWEGQRMTVNGKDINSDASMDLVIGNYCGGVALYLGDTNVTGIDESNNETTFDFGIYPNPSSGKFNLSMSQFEDLKMKGIEIYNIYGEKVAVNFQINSSSNFQIDLSAANGIYFCKVGGEKFSVTKKLVILK